MNIGTAGELEITGPEGELLNRATVTMTPQEAQMLRAAAKMLRSHRFRMTVRCDACFEGGRGDGMRGEINRNNISLECRCRWLKFDGATL